MPWTVSSVMEERLRIVARLLDGEAMTHVCREFGITRKTGYKIFDRYKENRLAALSDRSRRPLRYANQLPPAIESLIVRRVAAIRYAHKLSGYPVPTDDVRVISMALGTGDGLKGVRDRALLLLGFAGAFRQSHHRSIDTLRGYVRFSVDVNRNSQGVPKGAQIR